MSKEVAIARSPLARYGKVVGLCVLAGLVAGIVVGATKAIAGDDSPLAATIIAVSTAIAMGAGLWVSILWWRGLDEAAQEAHKWAWWWGSTCGLAVAAVTLFTLVYSLGDRLVGEPKDLFLGGAFVVAMFQTLGYAVAWGGWWLKRR